MSFVDTRPNLPLGIDFAMSRVLRRYGGSLVRRVDLEWSRPLTQTGHIWIEHHRPDDPADPKRIHIEVQETCDHSNLARFLDTHFGNHECVMRLDLPGATSAALRITYTPVQPPPQFGREHALAAGAEHERALAAARRRSFDGESFLREDRPGRGGYGRDPGRGSGYAEREYSDYD